jgi:ABC-type multidrug transport system ATPase subunit
MCLFYHSTPAIKAYLMESILEVKNLYKTFGNFKALNGLDMEVPKGDIFGFLGSNGSGKSTTIRCILTLIKPDSGEILYNGNSIKNHRESFLKNIGCIVEKPDFYINISALKNLEISAKMYGVNPNTSKLMETLEMVGLSGKEKTLVKTFSQGMKQRLGIAQSLIHNPEIIILDEPTNGLDPSGIIDFRKIIKQLKTDFNKTIIISSHILSELELMVDSFIIIEKGKKVVQGKASELLSDRDMSVIIETNDAESLNTYLQNTSSPYKVTNKTNSTLTIKIDRDQIPALHQDIVNSKQPLFGFTTRKKLEDLFLNLTK